MEKITKPLHIQEKEQRVKYVRALERYVKSAAALLKREDFDYVLFAGRMKKNRIVLSKVIPVVLDSSYTKALENFANLSPAIVEEDEEIDAFHQRFLKEVNAIEKLKTNSSYKKEKHRNAAFHDGY